MEQTLILVSPIVVAIITQLVKKAVESVTRLASVSTGYRATVIRTISALLSIGAVIGTAALSGQPVDATSVETFANAMVVFMGSTGAYFLSKKR